MASNETVKKIMCVRDYSMEDETIVAFTEGKEYKVHFVDFFQEGSDSWITVTLANNHDIPHEIDLIDLQAYFESVEVEVKLVKREE